MAKEWKSKADIEREREREDELDEAILKNRSKASGPGLRAVSLKAAELPKEDDTEKLQKMIGEITPQLEQLNQLYRMYVNGVEKRPPIELRSRVEAQLQRLTTASKNTLSVRFQYQQLHSKYISYRDLWERMLKQFEKKGKGKRAG